MGFHWTALFTLLFILPIPALGRMILEKRAYMVQLYVLNYFKNQGYNIDLNNKLNSILNNFTSSMYYYMYPFSLKEEFESAVVKIEAGEKPFESPVFSTIDDILKNTTL